MIGSSWDSYLFPEAALPAAVAELNLPSYSR